MGNDNITIRNITSVPLRLKVVERFNPPTVKQDAIANITSVFSNATTAIGLTNDVTRAPVEPIPADAKPYATQDVDIEIPPFKTVPTSIKPFEHEDKERIALTFETNLGGRHKMFCPVPTTSGSHELEPSVQNPAHRFTGIFLPQSSWVALYSSSNADHWMKELPDDIPLGALSIPGTHNSPACHAAPPSVRCQAVPPKEQLANGVRFFDVRVQVSKPEDPANDQLILVHSVFPISLTGPKYFRDLYNDIVEFLREHPSETLVLSLKREGTGNGTDQQLSKVLKDHYTNPGQWYTEPGVPTLGQVRGRIVLLRRFNLDDSLKGQWNGRGWGIDCSVWADNTADSTCPSGWARIQDFYNVTDTSLMEKKADYAKALCEKAGCCVYQPGASVQAHSDAKLPLFINFLSASNFFNINQWPEKIAGKMNPAMVSWLSKDHMEGDKEGDWSTGIIVTDWEGFHGDWDLTRVIVGFNAKLIPR